MSTTRINPVGELRFFAAFGCFARRIHDAGGLVMWRDRGNQGGAMYVFVLCCWRCEGKRPVICMFSCRMIVNMWRIGRNYARFHADADGQVRIEGGAMHVFMQF